MAFAIDPLSIAIGAVLGAIIAASIMLAIAGRAKGQLELVDAERQRLEGEVDSLQAQNTQLEARTAELRAQAEARTQAFEDAKKGMADTFEALAGKALAGSTEKFLQTAEERFKRLSEASGGDLEKRQEAIAALVKPMQENLGQMREQLSQLEKDRHGAYTALQEQVKSMGEQHQVLRDETSKLNNALRNTKHRGNWGELQLRNVVEMAGMLAHVDFTEQTAMVNDEGKRQLPDMVVKLPGGQRIAVDAKVPLDAFLKAAEHPEDAARFHEEHAAAVAKHVKDLGSKSYWKKLDYSPEFVVLFMPGEHYFSVALDHRPGLIQEGMDNHVIIATPTTLLALLRAVHFGWRQESIADNARKIAEQGKVLYDRIETMTENLSAVGKGLTSAVKGYNKFVGSVESRVLPAARKMAEIELPEAGERSKPLELTSVEEAIRETKLGNVGKADDIDTKSIEGSA